jgi:diadenosine tetraphosphatase ApaH/serine/threonine PP2A family protein phosphatase
MITWRRLSQLRALCVQGVGDRALATLDTTVVRPRDDFEKRRLKRLLEVRAELGGGVLEKLAKLPRLARQPLEGGRQLLIVHGSPLDPLEPMSHDMDDGTLAHMLGDDPADVVLCGGSHVPFDRMISRPGTEEGPRETRIINLGSVGEAPCGDESRFAHATFVESMDDGIEVEQFVVPLGRAA